MLTVLCKRSVNKFSMREGQLLFNVSCLCCLLFVVCCHLSAVLYYYKDNYVIYTIMLDYIGTVKIWIVYLKNNFWNE